MAWMRMMGAESVAYHKESIIERGDDYPGRALAYYGSRGETPLMWGGSGCGRLGLEGAVDDAGYTAIYGPGGARHPESGRCLASTQQPGMELVIAAHKSVAELGVIGRADDMHRIMDAERDATLRYLDEVTAAAGGRRGRTAVATATAGLLYAHTRHATSRSGKTALLDYLSDQVEGWTVATAAGVESEMELDYSGLHQLCGPMLGHLDRLPTPQCGALAAVFGLGPDLAPDRFLVGLATLTLFAEVAERQPLICIVDDAQWLDRASALILGFIARRLLAEPIALVAAARTGIGDEVLAGLPELSIGGLADSDARALLLENVQGKLDPSVCDRIVAESGGNPLALLELPRTWTATDLAGGFGLPDSQPVAGRIEGSYARRVRELSSSAQLLVLAAAAEPLGDPVLLHRAAQALGLHPKTANSAVDAGLLNIGDRVAFTHPLVRTAAYRSASLGDRQRVHHALAEATDAATDPDRRVWHRAQAAPGPDEDVAAELERCAGRAQARGGVAATAAFLRRAVALTEDPARRAERALAAAQASLEAGAFDTALQLLVTAEAGLLDEVQRARVDLVRGRIAFASGVASDAPPLLLKAAKRLQSFDLDQARDTYLIAWGAAVTAAHLGGAQVLLEISDAIRALPPPLGDPSPLELLLDGLALLMTDGHRAAAPTLQRAARALSDLALDDVLRWGWAATGVSAAVWDEEGFYAVAVRQVQVVRDAGALAPLPLHLAQLGTACAWRGDFATAASLVAESDNIAAATGSPIPPYTLLRLRALQGREADVNAAIASTVEKTIANWAAAVLYNGLGRYQAAAAARDTATSTFDPWTSMWALPELVEAAVRQGDDELARDALERLAQTTQPCGTDFALGVEARCRALLSDGAAADAFYRDAIDRLGRTRLRPELARAHLLYGEWLRRQRRRIDARDQLRTAHNMLLESGMEAFAERARRELVATGETVRKRSVETRDELTPQEEQIARLARDGLSNPEIGAQLFLSARTVEWHLRKVFTKLGISSRRQLRSAVPRTRLPSA
jgi:DNA-binding CsgD family transcriptional regulator